MKREQAISIIHAAGFSHCEVMHIQRPLRGWVIKAGRAGEVGWERHAFMPQLREALVQAGFTVPTPSVFSYDGKQVRKGGATIATASSGTMAARIANALNEYEPGPRGF